MANHVLLNNIEHKDLKVITTYSAEYGDSIASTLTFPTEFGDVQKEYPILFQKNPETGKFQSVVLFGFNKHENLFLNETGQWNANYIPAVIKRGPFLIGFQQQSVDGREERTPVIHVDIENPRLSKTEGESVFLEYGGISPYLEHITTILKGIYDGMAISEHMFSAFIELDLIEPVTIEFVLTHNVQHKLDGNYTINQEKLHNLSGENLERLNRAGFLQAAFLVISSLSNIHKLIHLKNQRG